MVRKLVSWLLAVVLLFSGMAQVQAVGSGPKKKGIDVSSHQGYIDWDTVANYIDFAIIRLGYGQDYTHQDDTQWYRNVEACTRLNIPFGVYIYSYATSENAIRSEVRHVLRLLKGYSPSLPVYLDLEDADIVKKCTPAQILNQSTIFCEMIEAAGYTPGIYANANWWDKYLAFSQYNRWERWVAQYGSELHDSRPYTMWQYSNTESVPGIWGDVDMNYWYGETFDLGCAHSYYSYTIHVDNCTKGGVRYYRCTNCDKVFSENVTTCIASRYKDVPPQWDWAHLAIDCMVESGTFQGVSADRFAPDGVMTRAMAVTVIWRWLGCPDYKNRSNFRDVPQDAWYGDAVAWAQENNIVKGVGDGLFSPMAEVSREQFAVMLYRYHSGIWSDDYKESLPEYALWQFSDRDDASDYAVQALSWAVNCRFIQGSEEEGNILLLPGNGITRAQVAVILYRLMG